MSTICQHLYTLGVEVKFTRIGEICVRVSDCEELVGGQSHEMMEIHSGKIVPDPPKSSGISLNLGKPSLTETVLLS